MARFSSTLNRYVKGDAITPASSAARTATGNSGWLNAEDYSVLHLLLDVTAASGTSPTLDVSVETALDSSGTNSRAVASFAQKTGTGSERKTFSGVDRFYRVVWTIGGTSPSFTFSVAGDAE